MRNGVLGIDIGGTRTKFGLVNESGDLEFKGSIPTQGHISLKRYLEVIHKEITKNMANRDISLKAIGIGAPKGNQETGCIEEAYNLLSWGDTLPIASFASDLFRVPAFLLNDSDASAIGEMEFGEAKGCEDFIVVTLGTGVGGGIITNGTLLRGSKGAAGEIGHMVVDWDGRQCKCGRIGCLETYASASGVVRTMRDLLVWKRGGHEEIHDYDSCEYIAQAARNGDSLAIKAFEYTGKKLGMALANITAIIDPEAIILSGGVAQAGELLLGPVKTHFDEFAMDAYRGKVEIKTSKAEDRNMAVMGAAGFAMRALGQHPWKIVKRA